MLKQQAPEAAGPTEHPMGNTNEAIRQNDGPAELTIIHSVGERETEIGNPKIRVRERANKQTVEQWWHKHQTPA